MCWHTERGRKGGSGVRWGEPKEAVSKLERSPTSPVNFVTMKRITGWSKNTLGLLFPELDSLLFMPLSPSDYLLRNQREVASTSMTPPLYNWVKFQHLNHPSSSLSCHQYSFLLSIWREQEAKAKAKQTSTFLNIYTAPIVPVLQLKFSVSVCRPPNRSAEEAVSPPYRVSVRCTSEAIAASFDPWGLTTIVVDPFSTLLGRNPFVIVVILVFESILQ